MEITIETTVNASPNRVWSAWVTPEDIKNWNFASDDWACPEAEIDLKKEGKFSYRMEAKDGSIGFDFEGVFTSISIGEHIEYELGDSRKVRVTFSATDDGVRVIETFEAEDEHSAQQQKEGWQAILENFKKHVESTNS